MEGGYIPWTFDRGSEWVFPGPCMEREGIPQMLGGWREFSLDPGWKVGLFSGPRRRVGVFP